MAERKTHTLRIIASGNLALPGEIVTEHRTDQFVEIPLESGVQEFSPDGVAGTELTMGRGGRREIGHRVDDSKRPTD